MAALFLLQIVDAESGAVVRVPAGGALERELVSAIVEAITAKCVGVPATMPETLIQACVDATVAHGVGLFRTEKQVKRAMAAGMAEALKAGSIRLFEVEPHGQAVAEGLAEAIRGLKTASKDAEP